MPSDALDSIRSWLRALDRAAYDASRRYLGPHATNAIQRANDAAGVFSSAAAAREAGHKAQESYEAFEQGDPLQGAVSAAGSAADIMSTAPGAGMLPQLAILLGIGGARRLANAGMRHPDNWGGSNRVVEAQEMLNRGASPVDVWREHGWSNNAYGEHLPLYTAISDEPMQLRMPGPIASGPFERVVEHPELMEAVPELRRVPTQLIEEPSLTHATGRTELPAVSRRRLELDRSRPPESMKAASPDLNALALTTAHEAQHGAAHLEGLPVGTSLTGMDPRLYRWDTPAARRAREEFELTAEVYGVDPASRYDYRWPAEVIDAWEAMTRAANMGRYINDPGEMIARGEEVILGGGLPVETPRQLEFVDPYNLAPFVRDPAYDFSRYRPLDE